MEFLQSRRVVHRDLRSANILIKGSIAKVADFGLSKIIKENQYVSSSAVMFPVRYSAPEIVTGEKPASAFSDVWSYGTLIYEVLTYGRRPFGHIKGNSEIKHAMTIKSAKLNHNYEPPLGCERAGKAIDKLIKSIWDICDGCMKYDTRERLTFEQISEKMDALNLRAPGPPPSAPRMSDVSNGNRFYNGAFTSS